MSVFVYAHRRALRTKLEFYVKIFYLLLGGAMLITLLVTFFLWVSRVNNVWDDYWSGSSYKLTTRVSSIVLPQPPLTTPPVFFKSVDVGSKSVRLGASFADAEYLLATATDLQNMVVAVAWPAVVLSLINKILFRLNWWHFRYYGLLIRTNIILPTLEIFFHVWAIVAITRTDGPCSFASDYMDFLTLHSRTGLQYVDEVEHNFSQNFTALLVVLCINLCINFIALIFLVVDSYSDENSRWARAWYKDYHRRAKKGVPGPLGDDANKELVPPKAALLRVLDEYPEILQAYRDRNPELAAAVLQEERRTDPNDGGMYTKGEFLDHYGGVAEWDNAPGPVDGTNSARGDANVADPDAAAGGVDLYDDVDLERRYSPALGPSDLQLDADEFKDHLPPTYNNNVDQSFGTQASQFEKYGVASNPPRAEDV